MGNRTNEILRNIQDGTSTESAVDFVSRSDTLQALRTDMEAAASSLSKFALDCAIQPSHLCEFLKGTKNLNRDKLLAAFIHLHYSLDQIQTLLCRLGLPMLYVRNKRDYQIAVGIKAQKSLDEIDVILNEKHLTPLGQYAKDKGIQLL